MAVAIEVITPNRASAYKAARLAALRDAPTAFGSTYARESQLSDADWLDRAAHCAGTSSVGYLAMDGQTACGIVIAAPDANDSAMAWVESMWVAPSHRRLGVGRLLIDAIGVWAGQRGIRTLKLMVTGNNESAIRFYRRVGFCATGNTLPYPNDPRLIENEMMRPL
jgi:ribosomal protein S18 acetylase RimI-like enzyme